MAHTPGPWTNYKGQSRILRGPKDEFIADVKMVDDAKLICAAPDLLEACKEMPSAIEALIHYIESAQGPMVDEGVQQANELLEKINKAIQKAEGK